MHESNGPVRRCVVSLGINSPQLPDHPRALFQDFPRGVDRIRRRLQETGFAGDFLSWDREYPAGSPRHEEARAAFKPFCFIEAKARGYDLALWLDSGVYISAPLDPLFEVIKTRGYYFVPAGHSVGRFCRDEALAPLGISREKSFALPSAWSFVVGLDLRRSHTDTFLEQWRALATDGVTHKGPKWSGVRGYPRTASSDPRVHGHRSQGPMSVLALRLGMDQWSSKAEIAQYLDADRTFVRRFDEAPASAGPPR
jgi:hypothetical protein